MIYVTKVKAGLVMRLDASAVIGLECVTSIGNSQWNLNEFLFHFLNLDCEN